MSSVCWAHYRGMVGLLFALCLAGTASGLSTPSSGDGSQTGDGSTAYTGLAQAPEANLFVGSATTAIALQVPPGRRSVTPALALSYASNGGPSPYGHGWDIPLPRVQRSTKRGALLCPATLPANPPYQWSEVADPLRDEFVLSMPGATIECTRGANGTCVPHVEEAFIRIKYDSANKTFVVWDKGGTRFTFGETQRATDLDSGDPGAGGFTLPARTGSSLTNEYALVGAGDPHIYPQCEYIYSWALTSIEDPYGNRLEIRYRLLSGVLYPHRIIYGGNVGASLPHRFAVDFAWENRPTADRPSFSIGGFRAQLTKRLKTVAMSYNSQAVRSYELVFEDDRHGRQSMLAGVSLKGTDGISSLLRADGQTAAATFAYKTLAHISGGPNHVSGFSGVMQRPSKPGLTTFPNALRWYDDGETKRDVFDINGDGFADLVDSSASCSGSSSWRVYLGSKNGFGSAFTCWALANPTVMNVIRGKGDPAGNQPVKKATLDITGDGVADFIDARNVPWIVYKGTLSLPGGGSGFAPGVTWFSPYIGVQAAVLRANPTGTSVTADLMDMNGDGRLDYVLRGGTSTTYWIWHANTGSGFAADGQRFDTSATGVPGLELSFVDDANGLHWGAFDINGDGFPDHVNAGATAWVVCINSGQEFDPCESWALPNQFPAGYVRKSTDDQSLDTVRDFFDLTGDGLPDIVDKSNWGSNGGNWEVLVNRGGGFETETITVSAPKYVRNGSSGGGAALEDTFDIDGDGLVDHVFFDGSDGSSTSQYGIRRLFDAAWKPSAEGSAVVVENAAGLRPDLLVLSESGSGGSTALSYRPSTQWTNTLLPFNIWTLTDLVHRDGLCPVGSMATDGSCSVAGHEVGTTFVYQDGLYDWAQREFRGFGLVQSEAIVVSDDTPHAASLTFFHQSAALAGKIWQVWNWNAAGAAGSMYTQPLSGSSTLWECAKPSDGTVLTPCPTTPAGDVWVRLKSTTNTAFSDYSWAQVKQSTTVNELWHECTSPGEEQPRYFGNVAHARRGGASASEPQLHTYTEFACRNDATGYIVDRPTHVLVKDEGGSVLEERWFYYDGYGPGPEDRGKVDRGGATRTDALVDVNDTAPAPACAQAPASSGGCITTSMVIDDVGNVTYATDGLGRTTKTDYDTTDRLYPELVTLPAPVAGQAQHKVKSVYDPACGKLLQQTIAYTASEPGPTERTRMQYDLFCRPWKTWVPGDAANATPFEEMVYQIGAPATSTEAGSPTATKVRRREPSNPDGVVISATLADGLGRTIQSKAQRVVEGLLLKVAVSTARYDELGRVSTTYEPFLGSVQEFTYNSPTAGVGTTTFQYDALGRPTRIDAPGPGYRSVDHTNAWETITDDECAAAGDCTAGQVIERRDALGRTAERLQYSGGVLKARTRFQYDAQNRLRTTTQGDANAWNESTKVETIYDTLGRRVELRDPDSGTWRYRFDKAGALILQDDPRAERHIELCYDGMGRVTKKQYVPQDAYLGACAANTQEQITYQYTTAVYGLGRPSQITDQTGTTVFAEYSVKGEPKTVQRQMDGVTAETRYSYDSVGKLHGMLYPDNEAVVYGYNEVGQPYQLSTPGGPTYLQSVTYDIYGRPRVITHGNGAVDTREYGTAANAYRLERVRADRAGVTLFNYGYTEYSATGLLEQVVDNGWVSGNPPEMKASATYTYDGLGRMLTASDVAVRQYEYDLWGNIKRNDGVTIAYTDAARPHQATGFGGSGDIDHDENGNRTARLGGALPDQSYDYDWDDRVRRVTVNGGSAVDFGYDASGQRTIERRGALAANGTLINPEVTRFYSDVYQVNGATAYKYYVAGGMLVASRRATAPASLQVASASSGAVQVAGIWSGGPGLMVGLSPSAAAAAAGSLAAGIGLVLLIPGRSRRVGLGWRVHPADATLVIVAVLATSLPMPLWVRPAAAQGCDPQPTPTAVLPQDIHHYHLDHLGSPQTITTGDGTVLRQTRYHPYGAIRGRWLAASDSEQDRREFTGYYSEPLSELEYAGARLYDPKLAMFLTHDPAGQFASPYAYGSWSPLNGTDPTGTFWFLPVAWLTSELFVTAAAIGFAAGFAAQSIQAAVNGASVGGALNAGLEGGVAGALSAAIGLSILEPGLTSVVANVISEAAGQYVGPALFVSGLGQAGYGLSQGDFSGVIGLGVSIGIGFAIAQGGNGAGGNQLGADRGKLGNSLEGQDGTIDLLNACNGGSASACGQLEARNVADLNAARTAISKADPYLLTDPPEVRWDGTIEFYKELGGTTDFWTGDITLSRGYPSRGALVESFAHELGHAKSGILGRALTNIQDAYFPVADSRWGLGQLHNAIYQRAELVRTRYELGLGAGR